MTKMVIARLTLVVEYEEMPDMNDVQEQVDRARGDGEVVQAELEITKPHTINLK